MGYSRYACGTASTFSADELAQWTKQAIFRFLLALRILLREHAADVAAVITIPGYLLRQMQGGPVHLRRLEWLCDSVIELESFAGQCRLSSAEPATLTLHTRFALATSSLSSLFWSASCESPANA